MTGPAADADRETLDGGDAVGRTVRGRRHAAAGGFRSFSCKARATR
jgi:hypothetical protein